MDNIKLLPSSIDAEEGLLSIIFQNNETLGIAKKYITNKKMFYAERTRKTWELILKLEKKEQSINIVTVSALLTRKDKEKYGDLDRYWLSGLFDMGLDHQIDDYSRIVAEKYYQRHFIKELNKIEGYCFDNTEDFNDIVSHIGRLSDTLQTINTKEEFDLSELLESTYDSIVNPKVLIPFGYKSLDRIAGGMTRGEITVVGGRPGHGKTTFVINLVYKLLEGGYKVLMLNREMKNSEVMKKLTTLSSGSLSYGTIRHGEIGKIDDSEIKRVHSHFLDCWNGKFWTFDDIFSLSHGLSIINKFKPDVIIDDYIQLIKVEGNKYEQRRFEIDYIMKEYKQLCKKNNMSAILVSQLNRNIEIRHDSVPKMSDLAESGTIEQVAENIFFVYYDYKQNYELSELGPDINQIVAAKVRFGTSRIINMGFDGNKCLFHENPRIVSKNDGIDIHIDENADIEEVKDTLFSLTK
jgi:replicative DNA helicase|tara:strand:- start:8552 stop:9946 length:1395 start_codon:yes stop_codon:yes gene_type:complete